MVDCSSQGPGVVSGRIRVLVPSITLCRRIRRFHEVPRPPRVLARRRPSGGPRRAPQPCRPAETVCLPPKQRPPRRCSSTRRVWKCRPARRWRSTSSAPCTVRKVSRRLRRPCQWDSYQLVLQHGNRRCRLCRPHGPSALQLQSGCSRQCHLVWSRLEAARGHRHRRRSSSSRSRQIRHSHSSALSYRQPREVRVAASRGRSSRRRMVACRRLGRRPRRASPPRRTQWP